jgi:hypothetical protein
VARAGLSNRTVGAACGRAGWVQSRGGRAGYICLAPQPIGSGRTGSAPPETAAGGTTPDRPGGTLRRVHGNAGVVCLAYSAPFLRSARQTDNTGTEIPAPSSLLPVLAFAFILAGCRRCGRLVCPGPSPTPYAEPRRRWNWPPRPGCARGGRPGDGPGRMDGDTTKLSDNLSGPAGLAPPRPKQRRAGLRQTGRWQGCSYSRQGGSPVRKRPHGTPATTRAPSSLLHPPALAFILPAFALLAQTASSRTPPPSIFSVTDLRAAPAPRTAVRRLQVLRAVLALAPDGSRVDTYLRGKTT